MPIATGCDKFCAIALCLLLGDAKKQTDGRNLEECEKLVKNGCKEITLLGQNVIRTVYRFWTERKRFASLNVGEKIYFTRLLEELDKLKTKGLRRVRWTSPHPKDMTDDVIEAVATLETQMPYIHLPVQAEAM